MSAPFFVGVAGDWHGNTRWAVSRIEEMARRLRDAGEESPTILHAGDFGIWPGLAGKVYLEALELALAASGAQLMFVDGNHEDFDQLDRLREESASKSVVRVNSRIGWLTRGHTWKWHGRLWMALGGAVSVDKDHQQARGTWWPQEEITFQQAEDILTRHKAADVMLCHDAPDEVPLVLEPFIWPGHRIRASDGHRRQLSAIFAELKPSHAIHGHYHQGIPAWRHVKMPYGVCETASLNTDGTEGNCGILDVRRMEWVE